MSKKLNKANNYDTIGNNLKGNGMKKKCSNTPKGPENGLPSGKAESVGKGKKTSTKTKGFK